MDDKWFKQRQKIAGVTADDIARELGRDRSLVSRIYVGRQKMRPDEAKIFARVLDVPLAEVMERAGILEKEEAAAIAPGFRESDATPFDLSGSEQRPAARMAVALGQRPGVDVWRVQNNNLLNMGYRQGDYLLVDTHQAERASAGDAVICQVYNLEKSTAETMLCEYRPPVIMRAGGAPDSHRAYVVDGNNVAIRGKVVASWRL